MTTTHALEITQFNLPVITMLNDGVTPAFELETTYFVFEIDEKGKNITTKIVTADEFADMGGYDGRMLSIHHLIK